MNYNILEKSINNAITRGDVELLVALHKDSYGVDNGDELRELIDNSVNEIARLNGLKLNREMSFKDFVVNVYDIAQAREVYNLDTTQEYIESGGIARARSLAAVLYEELSTGEIRKIVKVLSQVLLSLNGKYDKNIEAIAHTRYAREIMKELYKQDDIHGDYNSLELFLNYPTILALFSYWYSNKVKDNYLEYYINKYYPTKGINVLEDIKRYISDFDSIELATAINMLTDRPDITLDDKIKIVNLIFTSFRMEGTKNRRGSFLILIKDRELKKLIKNKVRELIYTHK